MARSARRRRKRRIIIVPVWLIILAAGGVASAWNKLTSDGDKPVAPAEWDGRVTSIVSFVEHERALTFEHPINVEFLPEADYVALFKPVESTESSDAEIEATFAKYTKVYDAWGWTAGVDNSDAASDVLSVTSLGFYSPEDDEIFVRGDVVTSALKVVLAHELTHALQGQHFDISLGGANDLSLRSIIEADAMRVEEAFKATLPPTDQNSADEDNSLDENESSSLDTLPWALVEQQFAPYALGPLLVDRVYAERGNAGVDELIADPPTEETLLQPWTYRTRQTDAVLGVDIPAGAEVILEPQLLSELNVLTMLDAWLPWSQARGALDGWAGGGYAVYQRDGDGGQVCYAAKVGLDGPADKLGAAVTSWAALSGSPSVPVVQGNEVAWEACERGASAAAPPTPVISPLEAIIAENAIIGGAGPDPAPEVVQRFQCYARMLIDDPSIAPLLFQSGELTADQQAIFDWVTTTAATSCG